MKGGSLLKFGLIAVGLYLLYRSGILAQFGITLPGTAALPPAPTPTGGGGSTAVPPASTVTTTTLPTGGGGTTAAAPVNYTAAQLDEMTKKAAAGDMTAAAILTGLGVRYNGHQWNWFREQAGNPPAPGTAGLDNTYTATEYLAYRASLGLGNLISFSRMVH